MWSQGSSYQGVPKKSRLNNYGGGDAVGVAGADGGGYGRYKWYKWY